MSGRADMVRLLYGCLCLTFSLGRDANMFVFRRLVRIETTVPGFVAFRLVFLVSLLNL